LTETQPVGVTVVVPTLNRGDYLLDCLNDLLAQYHQPIEILVVDQSESVPDKVQQLAEQYSETISYHRVSFKGLPLARNYGWKNARYNAIVYVDDDIRCPPNLVSEHLRALQLSNVGAVAGSITEKGRTQHPNKRAGHFRYWTASPERYFSQDGEYDVDGAAGCNFSTWRQIASEIGGIDERLNFGASLYEETEYCLRVRRAGYRVYYNSKAHLDHLVSPSGGCRVDQVENYVWALAHNRTLLIRRHLRWYQQLVAFMVLLRLGVAYAFHYRKPIAIHSTFTGIAAGLKNA
jgi:GT2 family glycosyltransferase